jgi:tetratricopeptide (TPR) repeat protein
LPERPQLPPAELRSRLFDAVARFLGERAAARPLVLFIDDLHWADAGTIALAHYLARRLREAPALFLGAYRELELDRAHPLAAALVTWNRERLITRLMLGRLSLADCSRMLATLFGQDEVQDDFAAAIYRETEGNPFFVEEVVKALVEQGAVYRADGEWHRKSLEELAIPQSIKDAIGRRLEALTAEELAHLHTAAVLGKQFEFAELAEATGAEEVLLDTLDRATAAQLLRVAGGERFAFTHDKIREVLYQELNPIRRRRIHQQVGGALERLYGDQIALHAADLAYHFTESADLERALRYALQAAKWALSLPAFDEAVRYYEHAREIAESLGQVETLYQVDTALGDTYFTSGHYDAAVQAFERALDRAPAGQEALARVKLGAVYAYLGREGSDHYLEETLAALDPETQPAAYAEANAYIGRYHHYQGRPRTALTFLHRAKEYAEAAGDPALIANTYVFLAGAHAQLSERVESSLWARRAIEFGREHGLPRFEAAGHEFLSETLLTRGLWRDALREAKRDNEIAHSIGSQTGILWSQFCRAWALWELGDLAEAQALAAKTVVQSEDAGDLRLAAFVRYIWSGIELALGNMESSEDSARRVLEASQHWQRVLLRGLGGKAMADVLLARGESGEAIAVLEGGLPPPEAETRAGLPPTYDGLAQAYLQHGDLATAEHYAEALQAFATETGSPQNLMLARLSLARIASRRGDADAAVAAFAEAIGGFEELESRPDLARALHFRAQFHQAQGDATAAVEDLQAALALASEMGMSRLERQVQAALATL